MAWIGFSGMQWAILCGHTPLRKLASIDRGPLLIHLRKHRTYHVYFILYIDN